MIANLIVSLLGLTLLLVGVWWVYPPATLVVAGGALLVVGLMREDGSDEAARPTDEA